MAATTMPNTEFTSADEGKSICTEDGVTLGEVRKVKRGKAYVRANDGLVERQDSLLATCWRRGRTFRLDQSMVREITDGEVILDVQVQDFSPTPSASS